MTNHAPLPGPGWHPDPQRPGYLRYWDGRRWTDHWSAVPAPPGGRSTTATPWFRSWWVALVAVVLLVGAVGVMTDGTDDEPAAVSVDRPHASFADTGSSDAPSPNAAPVVTRADVPDLAGLDRDRAARELARAGLTAGHVTAVWSKRPAGTVLEQGLAAGESVLLGAAVTYVVAKAIPSVPGTAGRLKGAAIGVLRAAGYRVLVSSQVRTAGTEGAVLSQSPVGGTRMKPGGTVRLVVAHIVRPVAAAPSSCTAGYRPCLPPAIDYDCAGGSGDGPAYANGPIYVTGPDPYGLDSNGDGVACE